MAFSPQNPRSLTQQADPARNPVAERVRAKIGSLQNRLIGGLSQTRQQSAERKINILHEDLQEPLRQAKGDTSAMLEKSDLRNLKRFAWDFTYCPACTSRNVRRANRQGFLDELLRVFFISPFRCRACRHKFYRF